MSNADWSHSKPIDLGKRTNASWLLLGERGVELQHEWVGVAAEFSHNEWHAERRYREQA